MTTTKTTRKATAATAADWKAKDELSRVPPPASALDQAGAKVSRVDMIRTAKQAVEHKRLNGLRQNVDTRIQTLKASIDVDLAYCRNLIASRKHDKAIALMKHIVRKHDDMLALADKWTRIMTADAVKAALEGPKPASKIKVERKVKRYKRFSEK